MKKASFYTHSKAHADGKFYYTAGPEKGQEYTPKFFSACGVPLGVLCATLSNGKAVEDVLENYHTSRTLSCDRWANPPITHTLDAYASEYNQDFTQEDIDLLRHHWNADGWSTVDSSSV